jgi:hypothetical protein
MIDTSFLRPLQDTAIATAIKNSTWLFPALETAHFFGLSLLMGALLVMDLRLVGVLRLGSLKSSLNFAVLAMVGFGINVVSGLGFFISSPENYAQNPLFLIKMALVAVAGLNLLWFEFVERRELLALPEGAAMPLRTQIVGWLSLLLWTAIIVLGRYLPLLGVG